ncbi:MAG TPA: hypothetical protein VF575_00405 [Candidatus Saccharimonadales bacterium]|jgi:hypothetical protein
MAQRSVVGSIVRSALPESQLIADREFVALTLKYSREDELINWGDLIDHAVASLLQPNQKITTYQTVKHLGCMTVSIENSMPVEAVDHENDVRLAACESDLIGIHLGPAKGVHDVQRSLAQAADYIKTHESFYDRPYVVGTTYEEVGAAATRFGFIPMELAGSIDPDFEAALAVDHRAYLAINGKPVHAPELVVTYLPTEEFIDRFETK